MFAPDTANIAQNAADQSGKIVEQSLKFLPILAPFVAVITYWLGARKRERDRRYEFYRDTVITPSMPEINNFFDTYRAKLIEHSKTPPSSPATAVPRSVTKLHREFTEELYSLKDGIVGRIEVFDANSVVLIDSIVGQLDTHVSLWLFSKGTKPGDAITEVVVRAKRSLVRAIYKCNLDVLK